MLRKIFINYFVLAIIMIAALYAVSAHAVLLCTNEYHDTISWQVGQPPPNFNLGDDWNKVSCAASDNELAFIRAKYSNLPQRGTNNTRVTIWRGTDAVFIIDNLGKNN